MKIIKLITAVILLITILFFSACEMKKTRLPHSTGKTSEMLVVTNNKAQWNSKIGEKIKEFFGQEQIKNHKLNLKKIFGQFRKGL
jgi:CBS domain containing-hemolysin-like protein